MPLLTNFKSAVKKLPVIREIVSERDKLHSELVALRKDLVALKQNLRFVPPGHFYSPIPSMEEILKDESTIFGPTPLEIPWRRPPRVGSIKASRTICAILCRYAVSTPKNRGATLLLRKSRLLLFGRNYLVLHD